MSLEIICHKHSKYIIEIYVSRGRLVMITVFAVDCLRVEEKLAPVKVSSGFTVMCEVRKEVRNNLNEVKSE